MKRIVALALIVVFIAAGCIQPVQKLGCCLKVNASNATNPGCVLYNLTSLNTTDAFFSSTNSCNATSGCNVTVNGQDTIIPICTDDQIVSCISPNCVAMVCGDFAYKPRVAPGYTSVDQAQGDTPPDLNKESATLQFYKARCVLNPLDSSLRQIMKNSKSQIDVFRMGVGGSFDEFDQYRYYFPISDKFCNVNPPRKADDVRVDRYMNYLNGDLSPEIDPAQNVSSDCVQDPTVPGFLGFGESAASRSSTGVPGITTITYQPVVPDISNYKFSHFGRLDFFDTWQSSNNGFYTYDTPAMNQSDVYKKIDDAYYKKYLSIAHTTLIYDLNGQGTARAPFECDVSANDCYSGSCDTTVYNRGVMLQQAGDQMIDVVTDCNEVQDENGMTKVICAPTTTVTQSGNGAVPDRHYANVDILPMHVETSYGQFHMPSSFTSIVSDLTPFDAAWNSFNTTYYTVWEVGYDRVQNKVMDSIYFYNDKKKYCPWDYGTNNDTNTTVVCSSTTTTSADGPPAGGAVFFGKLKDDKTVQYRNNTIIGYSLVSPSDFNSTLLIKNCKPNMTQILPSRPNSTLGSTSCWTSCIYACWTSGATNLSTKCTNWCDPTQASPAAPCSPGAPVAPTTITETKDWIRVDLTSLSDKDWQELLAAFQPYFDTRATAIGNKGVTDCGGYVDPSDIALSSMPWVINYQKGLNDPALTIFGSYVSGTNYGLSQQRPIGYHMSATAAQALRARNIYDESMSTAAGTSACELSNDAYWWFSLWGNDVNYYYNIAFSRYIYLLKYNQTSKSFGQCLIDDNTKLPQMKTFGWCQACTTSTLAYQNITAVSRVYMPAATMRIQNTYVSDYATICTPQYKADWVGFQGFKVTDNVTCYNPYITDVNEYSDSIGAIGSPRTVPEATILKERMGNYLKSGIMPVLDISDNSDWNITNPDSSATDSNGNSIFCLFYFSNCGQAFNYQQYDFERLFGHMGASVAIVDHVSDANDAQAKIDEIINRTTELHDRCFGCLAAVHVDHPSSLQNFNDTIGPIVSNPLVRGAKLVDLITFDYQVSDHASVSAQGAQAVADDLTAYGRASLQSGGVPTMVVGFNVKDSDPAWSESNVSQLFNAIVDSQGELVKAGVIGIVYSPARGPAGNDNTGLVDVSGGVGSKTAKFCAFESAMHKMSTIPPNAMFTRVQDLNNTPCVPCNDLDFVNKNCGPPAGSSSPVCDNNQTCVLPSGANASAYKCPENTVVGQCTLCKDVPGYYHCIKTYANGTVEYPNGSMSDITSDLYLDVIGGIPKPNKCCLLANITNSTPYTYTKQSFATPLNSPLVFPKSGDPNVDCGFGSSIDAVNQLSNFCNVQQVPLKNYDINCNITSSP